MRKIRIWVAACCLASATAMAAPASESSVRQLLDATQAHKMVDDTKTQLSGSFNKAVEIGAGKKASGNEQQAAIDKMRARMQALVNTSLDWAKLEPIYVRAYCESFTEEEVQGMLTFYQTPAGQALVARTPLVKQKISDAMQDSLKNMMPEMQKIQADFEAEVNKPPSEKVVLL